MNLVPHCYFITISVKSQIFLLVSNISVKYLNCYLLCWFNTFALCEVLVLECVLLMVPHSVLLLVYYLSAAFLRNVSSTQVLPGTLTMQQCLRICNPLRVYVWHTACTSGHWPLTSLLWLLTWLSVSTEIYVCIHGAQNEVKIL